MDIISHILWTIIIFFRKESLIYLGFFSILPDIVAFGPFYELIRCKKTRQFSGVMNCSCPADELRR